MAASKKDVAKQQVKEDREKVREMYLSGKTVKEIANQAYTVGAFSWEGLTIGAGRFHC